MRRPLRATLSGYLLPLSALLVVCCATVPAPEASDLPERAAETLEKAAKFYRERVSHRGGYVWRYSPDLEKREGETRTEPSTAWVQHPGTASVGGAFLEVYEWLRIPYYLEAAREAAHVLVEGQLQSGGWAHRIELAPEDRRRYAYRVDPESQGIDTTTLDDGSTQRAIQFLMDFDRAVDFSDEAVHEAVIYALDRLVGAQYPNGAWPQHFDGPNETPASKEARASYPENWSRTWREQDYRGYYTFNDNAIAEVITTLIRAAEVYDEPRYLEAAEKGGDFILRAQLPEPQPGWAQQYDKQMKPAWARKIEPPAVTGGESLGAIRSLIRLYRATGKDEYMEPIPRALAYFRRSQLPDGTLARFYELETNRPLYVTRDYELSYSTENLLPNYAFKVPSWLPRIQRHYDRIRENPKRQSRQRRPPRLDEDLKQRVRGIIESADERGAWVESGKFRYHGADDPTRRVIETRTFIRNIRTLARYLAAVRREP